MLCILRVLCVSAVRLVDWLDRDAACGGEGNAGIVCDLAGRVQGQSGLYVLDGSLMPGTTAACNPSMTIAAIAERALDDLVAHDVGTTI